MGFPLWPDETMAPIGTSVKSSTGRCAGRYQNYLQEEVKLYLGLVRERVHRVFVELPKDLTLGSGR